MPLLTLLMRPTVILFLLLSLSAAANVGLWKMYKGQLERVGAARIERDQALAASQACSASVEALQKAAAEREKRTRAALRKAEAARAAAEKKASRTLQMPPINPAKPCESAEALIDLKLKERRP